MPIWAEGVVTHRVKSLTLAVTKSGNTCPIGIGLRKDCKRDHVVGLGEDMYELLCRGDLGGLKNKRKNPEPAS